MDAIIGEPGAAGALSGSRRPSTRTMIASGVALAVGVAGALWISAPATSQSTDDAYVAADSTAVAPKVHGLVSEVLVRDNQIVRAGQPLVRIDPEEFDARVASMQASLADAESGVQSAQAALSSLSVEERLSMAQVAVAKTSIRSAIAQADLASTDRGRYAALVATGAVARREADTFSAAAITSEQEAAHARALLLVSQQGVKVMTAKRPGLLAALATARAKMAEARAALDLAAQDRKHTLIVAPIAGVIGNRQVRPGDYVQPGSRLLTLVPLHALYVIANFKETQTGKIHAGQSTTITADVAPGVELKGVVDSLAPGSGSSFALLPFEPGTGNFTKIVQRVAVRIRFDANQNEVDQLRPGLSVNARVRLTASKDTR